MKKGWMPALILIPAFLVVLVGAFFLLRHFVIKNVPDIGGGKNPDVIGETDGLEMWDGNYTYVDNGVLLPVLAGTWESADGQYEMSLTEDYRIQLRKDGETLLDSEYDFVYLQPGKVFSTDLRLNTTELTRLNGTVIGEICDLRHEVSDEDENGRIVLMFAEGSLDTGTVEFKKQ